MRVVAASVLILLGVMVGDVGALDHKNLDDGRPLRLEDAYPIDHGEIAIDSGGGFRLAQRGANRGLLSLEGLYGALPNLQLGVGTFFSTDPREIEDRPKSGDVRLTALYNFNQETLQLPALAVKLGLDAPSGVDARGYGIELKGIVTKSIERLSLHVNAAYEFFPDGGRAERDGRYQLAVGGSYPLGAPQFTRATLVADVFTEQSSRRNESNVVGTELGLRYQLTPTIVWDVGVGTEFAGPASRATFFTMTGLSFGF